MHTENAPPLFPATARQPGPYPDPARPIGKAWAAAWAELTTTGDAFVDGTELAERSASAADLKASTMLTLFTRAANAGLLETVAKKVDGTRGVRTRTHYRIPR